MFLSELYNKTDHDIVEGLTATEFVWYATTCLASIPFLSL
jgi:hypothetical protein